MSFFKDFKDGEPVTTQPVSKEQKKKKSNNDVSGIWDQFEELEKTPQVEPLSATPKRDDTVRKNTVKRAKKDVKTRATDKEIKEINKKAKEYGMSRQSYMLNAALGTLPTKETEINSEDDLSEKALLKTSDYENNATDISGVNKGRLEEPVKKEKPKEMTSWYEQELSRVNDKIRQNKTMYWSRSDIFHLLGAAVDTNDFVEKWYFKEMAKMDVFIKFMANLADLSYHETVIKLTSMFK